MTPEEVEAWEAAYGPDPDAVWASMTDDELVYQQCREMLLQSADEADADYDT